MTPAPCPPDDPGFLAALVAAGLPVEDLSDGDFRYFVIGDREAFGGITGTGPDLLLRSVVVPEAGRGSGAGSRIVAAIAEAARDTGAARLWLLTTDAADFFARLGWRTGDRATAPDAIRGTAQFTSICPASASLMVRDLAG